VQELQRLTIHQPRERQRRFRHPTGQQSPDLIHQPLFELLVDATLHAQRRVLWRDLQGVRDHVVLRQRRCRVREVIRQRTSRQDPDFERADNPFDVRRLDACRRRGIDPGQPAVQDRVATARRHALQAFPQRVVAARPFEQSAGQRAVIETRTADEDGKPSARGDLTNDRGRIAAIARRGILFGGFDDVDEMMRDAALLRERDFVRADVEAAIHGRRIATDDLAVEALRQRKPQRALPRRRWPDDGKKLRVQAVHERTSV
jgi:hypothetical protein